MDTATVLSIQVGLPSLHGADHISQKPWQSGIFKMPVQGRVWLDTLNLAGDGQDDLHNHGGPFRAVLAYAAAHYPVWRDEQPEYPFEYGSFGENFTVSECDEQTVCLGDIFVVGEARLQVTQPRMPCWKLARRTGIKDITARVDARGWGGWYHRVLRPGFVRAGDSYTLVERPYPAYPIARVYRAVDEDTTDVEALFELPDVEALTPSWRKQFAQR
jgi:MOSC domain-containing protein YiiM